MKKVFSVCLILFSSLFACTSAVISGKATPDGRPLLWKHRDTGSLENKLEFINDSGYDFIGVANVDDPKSENIWMGMNEKGFAIMNTASYNINEGVSCDIEPDQEGIFMRHALEICANLHDFELMLERTSGQRGVAANFGVIDADGSAAYYETGFYDYTKFDVNDPEIAPKGYLVRTNFSISGTGDKGQGYIRYDGTNELFDKQDKISINFILKEATRNMKHAALSTNIGNMKLPKNAKDRTIVAFQDYTVRYWSASVLLIQGVLPGEDPTGSMLWPIMGFPLTTVTTPVFFSSATELPKVISTGSKEVPYLPSASLKLKKELFPLAYDDDNENYIDVAKLKNRKKTGYLQLVLKAEDIIIEKALEVQKNPSEKAISNYYKWLDEYVIDFYDPILSFR